MLSEEATNTKFIVRLDDY